MNKINMDKQNEKKWDESFGEHITKEFFGFSCGTHRKQKIGISGLIISLFIFAWGITWLGNDLGWWKFEFPFWPIVIILIAMAILFNEIKKIF